MDDRRRTTDDNSVAKAGVVGTMPGQQGNKTLARVGNTLLLGGFAGCGSIAGQMLMVGPPSTRSYWALLWFGVLAIVGIVTLYINRKALKQPMKGSAFRGTMVGVLGMALSLGFIYWFGDIPLLGIAFLLGGVALFVVGMLIALDKNAVDVSQ